LLFSENVQLQFVADKCLDIISVKRDNKTKKNVLFEVNKLYTKQVNGKKNCLLSKMEVNVANPRESVVTFTLTLLPNQILILPIDYRDNITYMLRRTILECLKMMI
jgi:hypothetical protein